MLAILFAGLMPLATLATLAPAATLAPLPSLATGGPSQAGGAVADGGRITAPEQRPKAAQGFVVELVMHHPDVKWPSAVHCREDGSLLVAEDPMDMPGPTDQPLDRIWLLRFAPDGTFTKTLFAERLFAVMGLQEIDGAVFVMNMPHVTVLRDRDGDGIAEERSELLTNLGPPAPGWPGGFNDHIVSGIRLGMDGFLYVSVGDKGVPLATGRDGSRVTLRGGGVVRLRPDGTRLEVVASGTRNHLDVAIDERDHLFTYDNTDDGLGWWTRLTHVMPTGYYGYPWDYHDRPERFLPCMKDDGGGSPVGGLVYREDAWPEEYRGDLFFCEWADQVVRRFKVERAGASYRCVLTEDFVTPGTSGEFRPLDVCESPDGRYLYVADWNHPGWQSPQVAGRVWRVRRADDRPGAPPHGGLTELTPAALEKAAVEDLLANLAHPAFRRRLAAQRELARRAEEESSEEPSDESSDESFARELESRLSELIAQANRRAPGDAASERAVRHLMWALADSPRGIPPLLAADALNAASADTRAQMARLLGTNRVRERPLSKILADLVQNDPDLMVRREAAIALGRAGDALIYWFLVRGTEKTDDLFVRFAIRQAMRALPCPWEQLFDRVIPNCGKEAREEIWLSLHERYDLELARALADSMDDAVITPATRARMLGVLAELHRKRPPWDGKWWQIQPAKTGWPAKTEAWEGTPIVIEAIRRAFQSELPEIREAALAAARVTKEAELFPCVRARCEQAQDDGERARLIALLAEIRDEGAAGIFEAALAAGAGEVRAAAVAALARVKGAAAGAAIERVLGDPDETVRAAAIRHFADHPEARRLGDYLAGLALDATTRERCRLAIVALRVEVRPALEELAARGELAPPVLAVIREIYDEPPPLRRWNLLGPLPPPGATVPGTNPPDGGTVPGTEPPDGGSGPGTVPPAPFGDEAGMEEFARAAGLRVVEAEGALPHGFVDLRARVSEAGNVAAYALARLESPIARTARCRVGSDDGVTVWVNGALVHENAVDRGWTPDQDRFEIPLRAGTNWILLRVVQAGGDWSFNVKVSDVPRGPLFTDAPARAPEAPLDAPYDAKAWREHALAHPGDAVRGRAIYFDDQGPGCARCHAIAGVGPKLGPDLRDVGTKYGRAELVASILDPSEKIQEGYTATNVFLVDGDVLSGLVTGEKDGVLSLADASGAVREIPLAQIKERRASRLSAMPAGLAEKLTREELADLVAWLETLKQ